MAANPDHFAMTILAMVREDLKRSFQFTWTGIFESEWPVEDIVVKHLHDLKTVSTFYSIFFFYLPAKLTCSSTPAHLNLRATSTKWILECQLSPPRPMYVTLPFFSNAGRADYCV